MNEVKMNQAESLRIVLQKTENDLEKILKYFLDRKDLNDPRAVLASICPPEFQIFSACSVFVVMKTLIRIIDDLSKIYDMKKYGIRVNNEDVYREVKIILNMY